MKSKKILHVLRLLNMHHRQFQACRSIADKYLQPNPCDTRAWSQIIVSALTGIPGLARKKGADLADGSDVKAANAWSAIDAPRFNGVLKAGTKGKHSGSLRSLNSMPHLYFVLWDHVPGESAERCRIWAIRAQEDALFRSVARKWFRLFRRGEIGHNFQLHPPIDESTDVFTNECGTMRYPLLFAAIRKNRAFSCVKYSPSVLTDGRCRDIE